jgi:hypothetical protein
MQNVPRWMIHTQVENLLENLAVSQSLANVLMVSLAKKNKMIWAFCMQNVPRWMIHTLVENLLVKIVSLPQSVLMALSAFMTQ